MTKGHYCGPQITPLLVSHRRSFPCSASSRYQNPWNEVQEQRARIWDMFLCQGPKLCESPAVCIWLDFVLNITITIPTLWSSCDDGRGFGPLSCSQRSPRAGTGPLSCSVFPPATITEIARKRHTLRNKQSPSSIDSRNASIPHALSTLGGECCPGVMA